jgi:hypothetical protein
MVFFALARCSLMAAWLSSPQPDDTRLQQLNRTRSNPRWDNFMMSLTLLDDGRAADGNGGSRLGPAGTSERDRR